MAHASIGRYRFDLVVSRTTVTTRAPFWQRLKSVVYERLMADTPPSEMAQAFAYSYGAARIPVR